MATKTTPFPVAPELKQRLAGLYGHMANRLRIKNPPRIIFTQNVVNAKQPFGKTAYYNPLEKTIKVYVTGRHPTDILRSFAHELIHHWQHEHGAFPVGINGGEHEHYAQKNPILRRREMEAYLLGNILFRDWQDEMRYGPINENLQITNPYLLQQAVKKMVFELIRKQIISSYHRERTSGDMDPKDFIEELSRKIELGIGKYVQTMNNRGNWENQPHMIKEFVISRTGLKGLIKERIDDAIKKSEGGWEDESWVEKYKKQNREFWQQQRARKRKEDKYFEIGFVTPHYCWYWDGQKIVKAKGKSHEENFGKVEPYRHFRGRFDMSTRELSITIPTLLDGQVSGKLETDAPPGMLDALNAEFKNPKIYYFPMYL